MSSFFTLPASQKKRRRVEAPAPSGRTRQPSPSNEDGSIASSDASDGEGADVQSDGDDEASENEDPAAKRIRLAEQYLANTEKEILEDEGAFDAADVDQENLRRRMGERLKEDTAETKGKLYRWIADDYDWRGAQRQYVKRAAFQKALTGVAIQGRFVYAVGKDSQLVKIELPDRQAAVAEGKRARKEAKVLKRTRGDRNDKSAHHHHGAILCVAAAEGGKFLATGGSDKKIIIWDATSLQVLKIFTQHRDAVTALAFRKGTNQLYSASKDRTIKIWSLDELAYVDSLFGHQDEVLDVDALARETCVTVGARDRTARFWKVVEEAQLVFRGGGSAKSFHASRDAFVADAAHSEASYNEGSMDRIAMIDDETFVTGSDNGSLSLWNIHKKKAVDVFPLAHGVDSSLALDEASAEQHPDHTLSEDGRGGRQPRWITALAAIPYSNTIVSGSWDGCLRVWKVSSDKRRIERVCAIGVEGDHVPVIDNEPPGDHVPVTDSEPPQDVEVGGAVRAITVNGEGPHSVPGIVNDLAIAEEGARGKSRIIIAAAIGKEHRLGRWKRHAEAGNSIAVFGVALQLDRTISGTDQK